MIADHSSTGSLSSVSTQTQAAYPSPRSTRRLTQVATIVVLPVPGGAQTSVTGEPVGEIATAAFNSRCRRVRSSADDVPAGICTFAATTGILRSTAIIRPTPTGPLDCRKDSFTGITA